MRLLRGLFFFYSANRLDQTMSQCHCASPHGGECGVSACVHDAHTPRSDANSRESKWHSHSTSLKAAHMPEEAAYSEFVIYLSGRLCWSVWCYVMCGCGRMLHQLDLSTHTPDPNPPHVLFISQSSQLHNELRSAKVTI